MTRQRRGCFPTASLWIPAGFLAVMLAAPSAAQEEDPFSRPTASEPSGTVEEADPFAAGAAPAPLETPSEDEAAAAPSDTTQQEEDPTVLALRELNPTTPQELMAALRAMMDYGRPDEAKAYLTKLLESKPGAANLASLQRKFGSGLFIRLSRDAQYQPEGAQLARSVLEAASQAAQHPRRLQSLVDQLNAEEPAQRYAATVDLRSAGTAGLTVLIQRLADDSRQAEHARIGDAIVDFGQVAVGPLLGMLQSPNDPLRRQAVYLLGRLRARQAAEFLIGPFLSPQSGPPLRQASGQALLQIVGATPTDDEAHRYLERRVRAYLEGTLPGRPDHEDMIQLWQWDTEAAGPAARRYPAPDAAALVSARLAADLRQLQPDNGRLVRLTLLSTLQAAKLLGGLDRPLARGAGTAHALASAAGASAVQDVLAEAIEKGYLPAALGAAEVLGDIGGVDLLTQAGGHPSTLSGALLHPDRRLRFAAVEAIMKIDPRQPYAGCSHLPEALGYFVRSAGRRRALVGHPHLGQGQTLVGILNEIGFEADLALSGRDVLRLARTWPDYELAMISHAFDFPDANETIQMLRRDQRTARLPIGLMAREAHYDRAARIAEADALTRAMPRPHDTATVAFQVGQLLQLSGRELTTGTQRRQQATAALQWMDQLAQAPKRYGFYDLLRQQEAIEAAASRLPNAPQAIQLLGHFATARSQQLLVDLASQDVRPAAVRQAAAQAFARAVERRGLLLNHGQILAQYDRYNESETRDQQTQQILGSVLDAIETPWKKRQRLSEGRATDEPQQP